MIVRTDPTHLVLTTDYVFIEGGRLMARHPDGVPYPLELPDDWSGKVIVETESGRELAIFQVVLSDQETEADHE